MAGIYGILATHYDTFNRDIDYCEWGDFVTSCFAEAYEGDGSVREVLDLGCGTGKMTFELAKRGYDMTGVDLSPEMLTVAREKAEKVAGGENILWLMQDMRSFELYGTVDAVVTALDGINHLTSYTDLRKCFSLVHNYLVPGGVFVFDINTDFKFKNIYSDRTYVYDEEDVMCIWENFYNPRKKTCDFHITMFEKNRDGRYTRADGWEQEKMYTDKQIETALSAEGFDVCGKYSDFLKSPVGEGTERIYYVAVCKK